MRRSLGGQVDERRGLPRPLHRHGLTRDVCRAAGTLLKSLCRRSADGVSFACFSFSSAPKTARLTISLLLCSTFHSAPISALVAPRIDYHAESHARRQARADRVAEVRDAHAARRLEALARSRGSLPNASSHPLGPIPVDLFLAQPPAAATTSSSLHHSTTTDAEGGGDNCNTTHDLDFAFDFSGSGGAGDAVFASIYPDFFNINNMGNDPTMVRSVSPPLLPPSLPSLTSPFLFFSISLSRRSQTLFPDPCYLHP